jgi:DNA gyrase subunit A
LLPVKAFDEASVLIFATRFGMVKLTRLSDFKKMRAGGLIAIDLNSGDELVSVQIAAKDALGDIMLFSASNRVNRFSASTLRSLSRAAKGVRCMRLDEG